MKQKQKQQKKDGVRDVEFAGGVALARVQLLRGDCLLYRRLPTATEECQETRRPRHACFRRHVKGINETYVCTNACNLRVYGQITTGGKGNR